MTRIISYLVVALAMLAFGSPDMPSTYAVDLHAFEFNEGSGFFLSETFDSGNPGGQAWVESNLLTDSETNGSGSFRITKFNDDQADNYLQIDNITSSTVGSRYIVVRMSGWNFVDSVVGQGEEIRFDFLDSDTGTSGSAVTSQVRIDRNTDNGNIELRGTAIGVGSTDIASRATLNTTQTAPFTMVLELDKKSNTYEVFYKDGTNPAQALGAAPISAARNGNSIRFTVNNNFGSDITEFFAIDRFALTDTNPLTDLMTLEVNRITGEMKLKNTTGSALSGLRSYSLTSASGALTAANWRSVTDFYDQAPGNGSVDVDGAWSKTSTSATDLSEGVIGGNGGNLSINQEVILSSGTGPWLRGIYEDLEMVLNFDGGITRKANVNFVGNGGERLDVGDLNFDGSLTAADWTAFIAGAEMDLSGLTLAQQYQAGDLNGDGLNDIFDFAIFKDSYDAVNGFGAFNTMFAAIPEPTSLVLLSLGCVLSGMRRCRPKFVAPRLISEVSSMKSLASFVVVLAACIGVSLNNSVTANAAVLEDFPFGDSNGTLIGAAANTANPGNFWDEDPTDSINSSVQNGVYRIQRNDEEAATNYLDIENITSGKAWLVADIAGWNFTPTLGVGEVFEEFRLAFLQNDPPAQGNSTLTAQFAIQRNQTTNVIELIGNRAGGGANIAQTLNLTHSRNTPFSVALEIDEDNNSYSIYYKDDTNPYTFLGSAAHDSARDGNSIRMFINNNFGGTGEFFDLSRVYLTDTDPTNVSNDRMTLQVNTVTGELKLINDTASTFDIDAYTITSATLAGDLKPLTWNSLSDQVPLIDPVDGPDGDSTLGNGTGETWDEAPGSSSKVLAERFLLGSSVFTPGRDETLGLAFQVGGDTNALTFQYRNADTGAIQTGLIDLIATGPNGDFDGDGDVDGRDFLRWQRGGSPAPFSSTDLAAWQNAYGVGPLSSLEAVPEPTALTLVLSLAMGLVAVRRNRVS